MKRDDIKKILSAPRAEQEQMLKDDRERLRSLKFDLDAGKVKNVAELRKIKKNIARLLTVLRQDSLEQKQKPGKKIDQRVNEGQPKKK